MPRGVYKHLPQYGFQKGHKQPKEELSPHWKGDKVGYSGIHYWIQRHLGKPNLCEKCGTTTAKQFHWANISGEYKRDLKDYKRLCAKCHKIFDRKLYCKQGHKFTAKNTYTDKMGKRHCRRCLNLRKKSRRKDEKKKTLF